MSASRQSRRREWPIRVSPASGPSTPRFEAAAIDEGQLLPPRSSRRAPDERLTATTELPKFGPAALPTDSRPANPPRSDTLRPSRRQSSVGCVENRPLQGQRRIPPPPGRRGKPPPDHRPASASPARRPATPAIVAGPAGSLVGIQESQRHPRRANQEDHVAILKQDRAAEGVAQRGSTAPVDETPHRRIRRNIAA